TKSTTKSGKNDGFCCFNIPHRIESRVFALDSIVIDSIVYRFNLIDSIVYDLLIN
ncbi:hypothetical protein HMPREF1575_01304, partial [Gardnerella vaginalis JCP7672]